MIRKIVARVLFHGARFAGCMAIVIVYACAGVAGRPTEWWQPVLVGSASVVFMEAMVATLLKGRRMLDAERRKVG